MLKFLRSLFSHVPAVQLTQGGSSIQQSAEQWPYASSKNQIAIALDRSGSMSGTEEKTVEAINGFLRQMQRDSLGKSAVFTLTTFDSQGFDVIRRGTVSEVKPLEQKEFSPRAATPLYDAVGDAISKMTAAEKNMLVILTDGLENASKKFTQASLRALIEEKRKAGWIIIYLGANIDAWKQAESIGVPGNQAMNFSQNGTQVPAQPSHPRLWSRFMSSVSQNPMGYALGTAALLGLAYLALRPSDAKAVETLGFTDVDRNASMGVDGVGGNTWQRAVEQDVASFDEPIKTDSIFDPGLSHEASQSATELPEDFDPTLGSMIDGEQVVDHGDKILSSKDAPSSDDYIPRDVDAQEGEDGLGEFSESSSVSSSGTNSGSDDRSFRSDPDPELSRYEPPVREETYSPPSRSDDSSSSSSWGSSDSGSSYDSGGGSSDSGSSSFD